MKGEMSFGAFEHKGELLEFAKKLDELGEGNWIKQTLQEVGKEMKQEFTSTALKHSKSGFFLKNTKTRLTTKGQNYSFKIYGLKPHWKGEFVWMEDGTTLRHRKYISKKRMIKYKNPEDGRTGYVKGKHNWSRLSKKYNTILEKKVHEKISKILK